MVDRSLPLGPYAAVFAPLPAEGRAEAVTRRLGEAIALGLLPDGCMLPHEGDLADRFGVATVTVREALGALREADLIVTRRGRGGGSFVRSPADGGRAAMLARLAHLGLGDLRDLADHYTAISGRCAYLAAERADEDDLTRLHRLAAQRAAPDEPGGIPRLEGNFHLELAAVAQSARLTREEMALQRQAGPLLWLAHAEAGGAAATTAAHERIASAVAGGDPGTARARAEDHVSELFDSVRTLHRHARGSRTRRTP
ncbi:GntR family transcriptional regulator [Intrasporangium oryzae NRRL B-24470]|uniref:GntR family transcriptional regulator n=1 Tax=Intrasporangium oryzae NRRL B-24470 TaxID=1386089 RepID=W9G8C9_9MICO|nr:FCD domain-containing protein [Intrasporangium oryzae]EWT01063.1 GntR family transcriptional regulator [Intrasporangium oryzae NRRL B-24470]